MATHSLLQIPAAAAIMKSGVALWQVETSHAWRVGERGMRFQELPRRLRFYILAHLLVLVPLLDAIMRQPRPHNPGLMAALLLFTMLFATWKVELTVFQGRMTLTFAVVCVALLLQGMQAAVLCASVGVFVGCITRTSTQRWKVAFSWPPLHRLFFNLANALVSTAAAAFLFNTVQRLPAASGVPGESGWQALVGLAAFTASYFLVNTVGVSLAISYQQGLSWFSVWQQNFLWTAPGYFASASAAAGIATLFEQMGPAALLFLPPLYIVYYSYRLYMERLHLYADRVRQDLKHIQELNHLNQAVISSLATAIDAKDSMTSSHINRVQHYAEALGHAVGLSEPELNAVSTAALVHDVGKLGIPDHILSKPGKLTAEEFRRIQRHVEIGTEILSPIPFPFPVVDIVQTHHERWDGLGYPNGLRGEEIPIGGRIVAVVDVFDALTSHRPYRRALTQEEALRMLQEGAGRQFDPHLVQLFQEILPRTQAAIEQIEAAWQQEAAHANRPRERSSALMQIGQAAAEMAAVCDVAHALAQQETLDQISRVVVNRALALLPADTAVLYLQSAAEGELAAVAVEGKYQERLAGLSIQVGEGVTGWVAQMGQPQVNVSAAADLARRFTPEETIELSAATAVPLRHGPEKLGVLAVYTMGYSVLTEHHLDVLNILAEHAAAVIQHSRRFETQRELAYTDPLTELANSRSLVRHLDRLTSRDASRQSSVVSGPAEFDIHPGDPELTHDLRLTTHACFSVLMLDLDQFKAVNDTLGHLQGDALLRQVAGTLLSIARPSDLVCRYAGDEFVLVLPGASYEQAQQVAERVRKEINALPPVGDRVKIGASVGAAAFPEDGRDGRTLLHQADQRMYEDKFSRRQARRLIESPAPTSA